MRTIRLIAALSLAALTFGVQAQDFPSRSIEIVVPFPPGGATDTNARALATVMSAELDIEVVVVNTPGSSGAIGIDSVAKAQPDGYTLLFGTDSFLLLHLIGRELPYARADFTPLAKTAATSHFFAIGKDTGATSLAEFIALAKAAPGKYSYATGGVGTNGHLMGELLEQEAGIDLLHVPYQGSAPAVVDVVGGRVDMIISGANGIVPFVETGELIAMGMTGPERQALFPDIPTMDETIPGFVVQAWNGVFGPAGMDPTVAQKLSEALATASQSEAYLTAIVATGAERTEPLQGEDFDAFLDETEATFRAVIDNAQLTFE